ncbi:TC.MATE [Mytilus coruscus]|uniref:TC.MATE n=1 Tax=Mytilus coruscus TaxID=42192 RepID=A0A6J8B1M2_MYTCO|nr:TC.MATE [Mytilus coruscus]
MILVTDNHINAMILVTGIHIIAMILVTGNHINAMILVTGIHIIAMILVTDIHIIAMILVTGIHIIAMILLVLNGILRGTGHQKYGGIVTVIAHYVIGVPLMVVLVLYTSLEIAGDQRSSSECSCTDTKPSNNDCRQLFGHVVEERPASLFKVVICKRCLMFVSLLLILVASIVLNVFLHNKFQSNVECFQDSSATTTNQNKDTSTDKYAVKSPNDIKKSKDTSPRQFSVKNSTDIQNLKIR